MSSASVTNMMNQTQGLSSSSMRIEEEAMLMMMQKKKNQGIVTILGSGCCDTYTTSSASSLRRTFSADMSSKNWLSHNNNKTISTSSSSSSSEGEEEQYEEMKKEEFDADAEAESEAERERLEIWSSIQRNKKEEQEKSSSPYDTWGTIMNLKGNNEISKSLPVTPYVHPLVKRSKSSLNEKSLEICTESLGSETGSDGLLFSSSYPSSESEDNKDREQQEETVKVNESAYEAEQDWFNNHHAITTKKSSPARSFPPPLPSLSLQANNKNGASLHMRPHRDNGRLVLEAVSLPSQNNFNAQRQDGRLVLTFTDAATTAAYGDMAEENYDIDEGVEDLEEEFEGFEEEDEGEYYYEGEYDDDDEDEEEEEEEEEEGVEVGDVESVMMEEESSNLLSSNVHRLTLMMNKPIELVKNNRNQNWSEKFNQKGVNLEEVSLVEMEPTSAVAQSLPQTVARLIPSSSASAAATSTATSFNFNAYEYYWRTKPTTPTEAESDDKAIHNQHNNNYYSSSPHHNKMNNYGSKVIVSTNEHHHQQQLLVLRGKNGDYLVHNLKSCKDSRRPFLFWEPYCIATS